MTDYWRLYTIDKGDNHIKIIMVNLSLHLTLPFLTN